MALRMKFLLAPVDMADPTKRMDFTEWSMNVFRMRYVKFDRTPPTLSHDEPSVETTTYPPLKILAYVTSLGLASLLASFLHCWCSEKSRNENIMGAYTKLPGSLPDKKTATKTQTTNSEASNLKAKAG